MAANQRLHSVSYLTKSNKTTCPADKYWHKRSVKLKRNIELAPNLFPIHIPKSNNSKL